jgi:hypothetical protein
MADIKEVVDVQIEIQSSTLKSENFNLLLILGTHKVFTELYRRYNDVDEMLSDGFRLTDKEYIAANAVFRQSPSVPFIYVGRRQANGATLSVETVKPSTDYWLKINSNIYTYNSGATPTKETIAAGIVAAAGADPVVNITDHLDGTYTVDAKIAGTAYTLFVDDNQIISSIPTSKTIIEDLEAIKAVDNEWTALLETGRSKPERINVGAWCESEKKLFGTASADGDIIDKDESTDLDSIPALFKAAQYHYSWCIYHENIDDFIDAAWMGREIAKQPGASTWALKELVGITGDKLTPTQSANALSKQCNTYEYFGGIYITRQGTVFDNKFIYIDITRGLDWLINDIQTAIFNFLIEADKVPYTDAGITMVGTHLSSRLKNAVGLGLLAADPAPVVILPKVINIPEADKIARNLKEVDFTAVLTNAIQKIEIRGKVSY